MRNPLLPGHPEKRSASLASDPEKIKEKQDLDHPVQHGSALSLLMTGLGTNHPDNAIALDDFALAANAFNRCSDFHGTVSENFLTTLASLATLGLALSPACGASA